jgi:hypothetical protein
MEWRVLAEWSSVILEPLPVSILLPPELERKILRAQRE